MERNCFERLKYWALQIASSRWNNCCIPFCYDTDNEEEIEIGYIGGKDIDTIENYLSFYKGAVEQLLSHYALVSIEADDVDPYAFTVLNCFKYDPDKSLDAYIL